MKATTLIFVCAGFANIATASAQENAKTDLTDVALGDKRYDVQPVTVGAVGVAILVDHQTGKTWILSSSAGIIGIADVNSKWTPIPFAPDLPTK